MAISTTLKLPDALKARVAAAAGDSGKTAHAWMLEAIEAQASLAERRREFVAVALRAEEEVAQYGLVHDGDEVASYLLAKAAGKTTRRPRARKR